MNEIRNAVKKFNKKNGNETFTTKELVIYFNNDLKTRMLGLENKLMSLPCNKHVEDIIDITTTLRNIKTVLTLGVPALVAIVVAVLKLT